MKALFIAVPLLAFSFISHADEVDPKCAAKAEQVVAKFVEDENYYDENGIETYDCTPSINNKVLLCEVSASKGDGAANDTYLVVLNLSCDRAYRVQLIGEE